MKRKVKFQEGGAVEEPSPRSRMLRERMNKMGREGRRVGLAERARERERARQEAARREAAERASAQRDVAEASRNPAAYESDRRRNIGPQAGRPDFTTSPEGTTRRGAATGREVVPAREQVPARPSASRALSEVATPRQMPLGSPRPRVGGNLAAIIGATALEAAEPVVNYGRRFMERRGAEADAQREANLQAFRDQQQERVTMEQELGEAAQRMPTPRPAARPAPAPARRELTMEEIRALRSGERAPRTSEERALIEGLRDLPQPRPRIREMTADELNEMELRRIRAERQMEEQRGGSGNIGAASARERGEQVGPPGQYNMKKGGKVPAPKAVVKKKAGGMIAKPKAAPAKMKKGGAVAKPKGKPMPFKKGGVIKKGRK